MMPNSQARQETSTVHKLPSLKDNFGLTKTEFVRSVNNMKEGDDSFITHNMVHQLPESMTYLQNRFHIDRDTAYDICMDTFIVFREKLLADKIVYGNLRYLFTRMCQNHFIDRQKKKNRVQTVIDTFQEGSESMENDEDTFFLVLNSAIDQLEPEQKKLLKAIYYSGKKMNEIADELNISYDLIRKKKQRILKKLRTLYFETSNKESL